MKHTKTAKGGLIIWDKDDWRAGLGLQGSFSLTQYLTQTDSTGFQSLQTIDPYRFYGTLCPGWASGANATNSGQMTSVQVSFELKDNSLGYSVDAGGKIQKYTIATNTITNAGSFPHAIAYAAGNTYVGQDSIIYRHNISSASTVSMFYSAYNSNNWDVGTMGMTSETFDDNYMSSVPASPLDISTGDGDDSTQRTAPHPMEIGADGILYIGSGRYIHAYDGNTGAEGTFYSKVLTLPQGFQITALKKYQNLLLIVGNYYATGADTSVGDALLYTWDYTSADVISVLPLEDMFVSALFLWNGSPTVITQGVPGNNGINKVKVVSGNQVTKIADFSGTIPVNRGVVVQNDIIYMNSGGKILAVGDKFQPSDAINHLYSTSATGLSGVLVCEITTPTFIASSATAASTAPCLNSIFSNNGMGAGRATTYFFDPEFPYNKTGRVMSVIVKYYDVLAAAGSNGTLTFSINQDNNTTTSTILSGLNSVALPLDKKYTETTVGGKLPTFSTIGWTATWIASSGGSGSPGPIISRVEIEYETEELPISI